MRVLRLCVTLLSGNMLILTTTLEVYPLRNVILPPLTSEITKAAFTALWEVEPPGKWRTFSVLFREGKPLYRCPDPSEKPTARAGERLTARISLLCEGKVQLPKESSRVSFKGSEFEVRVIGIEVVKLKELRTEVPRTFTLRFLTPTLLPIPGRGKLMREVPAGRRYKLLPDLPLALYLLAHDLRMQGVNLVEAAPSQLFRWAYQALAELDYSVRPEVVLRAHGSGKPLAEKGFAGYVLYELLDPASSYARDLARLLGYMLRFGVGKFRSIGFGHVVMEPPPRNPL